MFGIVRDKIGAVPGGVSLLEPPTVLVKLMVGTHRYGILVEPATLAKMDDETFEAFRAPTLHAFIEVLSLHLGMMRKQAMGSGNDGPAGDAERAGADAGREQVDAERADPPG